MSDHCRICHQDFTDPSFGGPGICPACDCGIPPDVTRLQRTVAALTAENERLRSLFDAEDAKALDEYAEDEARSVGSHLHHLAARIRAALPSSRETTDG